MVIGLLVLSKNSLSERSIKDMESKKFALVTGCGKGGIGQALARHLLQNGQYLVPVICL